MLNPNNILNDENTLSHVYVGIWIKMSCHREAGITSRLQIILYIVLLALVQVIVLSRGTVYDPLAYETISKLVALFSKIHACQSNPKCVCLDS